MCCSYTFITISLTGSRRITEDAESGELVLQQSVVDHYSSRTTCLDLSLLEFAANFSEHKGEVKQRSSPVIVRTFPQYSSNSNGEKYDLYCKYQLVKHVPWTGDLANAWGGGEGSSEQWIAAYRHFLTTHGARERIPNFLQELHLAQQRLADEDSDDEDPSQPTEFQDEWMLLCQQTPRFADHLSDQVNDIDWEEGAHGFSADLLRNCPTWITSQRRLSESSQWAGVRHRQLPEVDISTLDSKQRCAYDFIQSYHTQFMSADIVDPIRMIVSGTAGTGKTYLITAIANLLQEACTLTGTTGMASFLICGKTVHSDLNLPVRHNTQKQLQGATLQKLLQRFKDKHYIIIDEMSMIGHRILAWIDERLKQASGKLDCIFGGFSIILFGDFGQLPPVGDRPLYAPPTSNPISIHGRQLYLTFNTVVILDQVLRQGGIDQAAQQFRQLLQRLRDGNVTEQDWKLLLERDPSKVNCSEFSDAIRLFYDKVSVAEYNLTKLKSLGEPIAKINAIHSNPMAANAKPDDAGGLYPVVCLAVHARVMLTANLWPEVGLCNGSAGTVYKILYQDGHRPPHLPIAVVVDFDTYIGPPFLPDHPKCIPIPPITFEWYAITIHKSQGQTLKKAVVDIGKSELSAGCTFVAISRLPRLECGMIQPMSFQRLKAISAGRNFKLRVQKDIRLQGMSLDC